MIPFRALLPLLGFTISCYGASASTSTGGSVTHTAAFAPVSSRLARQPRAFGQCLSAVMGGRVERPANEFSRSYRVEGILSGGHRQRDYSVKIEAKEDELEKLASRFDLNRIYQLEADVALRRERLSTSSAFPGVEVEGTVTARVDQVCVRTGEIFDVDVQFPLFAIVRPIAALGAPKKLEQIPNEVLEYDMKQKQGNKNDKKKRDRVKTHNLNEMDMGELQKLLQDFDVEDDVIED